MPLIKEAQAKNAIAEILKVYYRLDKNQSKEAAKDVLIVLDKFIK